MKDKSCGAVVYKKENNILYFLLVYQSNGNYSFPKGHVEGLETEEETAIREIKEETNIDVNLDTNFREVTTYFLEKKGVYKDVVFFVGTPKSNDLRSQEGEIEECSWNTYDEVLKKLQYKNMEEIFLKAYDYIKNFQK